MAVLVIAFIALRHPKDTGTAAGTQTATITTTRTASPGSSSPSGTTASTSPTRHRSTSPAQSTQASRSTRSAPSGGSSSTSAVGSQPLVVLNQGLLAGTAAAAAQRFTGVGWKITSTDENYVNDVITTTAYYDPSVAGAKAAADALAQQFPTIHRVAERFSNLPAGPVVVVLTNDYSPG